MDVEVGWTIERGDVGDSAGDPARVATSPARGRARGGLAGVGGHIPRLGLDRDQGRGADGRAGRIRVPGCEIKIGGRARAIHSMLPELSMMMRMLGVVTLVMNGGKAV